MSIEIFRSGLTCFDSFCCVPGIINAGSTAFAPQDTRSVRGAQLAGGRADAAAAAFGSTTSCFVILLDIVLYVCM